MDETSKRIKKMYVGQIINRIILIIVFLLLIVNLGATAFVGFQIKKFNDTIAPAVEVITKLDVEELNKTLTTLNQAVEVFKIDETLETLSKIDFQGFNDVISGIDVDKLNSTLEKIDDASQFMKRMGDGMRDFLNQFGINIGNK